MPTLGNYNPYGMGSGSYNPLNESWYGVPNYGANYSNYLQTQQQPLSLSQIMGMVQQIQETMNPMERLVSSVSQAEIPARIAQNMMSGQNRLLSLPRSRMEQGGSNALPPGDLEQYAGAPSRTTPGTYTPSYGSVDLYAGYDPRAGRTPSPGVAAPTAPAPTAPKTGYTAPKPTSYTAPKPTSRDPYAKNIHSLPWPNPSYDTWGAGGGGGGGAR